MRFLPVIVAWVLTIAFMGLTVPSNAVESFLPEGPRTDLVR